MGYSWSVMEISGTVPYIAGLYWKYWVCIIDEVGLLWIMDIVGLLWIKWVCYGYSGSVMDIVGL